ncbi:MAG: hypothetical protein KAI47_18430 [Deltaproteobacteria bacterium]|nr:hypothetical protein [Deltaproteobacteria bacterium]
MAIELGAVRAVVVFSDDPARLADWYKKVFALREFYRVEGFVGLAAAGVTFFIQRTSEGHTPGIGGIRPHFVVASCRVAHASLVEAGATSILGVTDTGDEWVAAVQDPDGNPLGLFQPKQ